MSHPRTARRSPAATIATGLASLAGIILIVLGVPAGLWALGGSPLPAEVPDAPTLLQALTRPDDGSLFIGALRLLGWAAWASFTVSLLLEVPARVRGLPAPSIPGLRWQQGQAGTLVASVAAMIAVLAGPAEMAMASSAPPTATAAAAVGTGATALLPTAETPAPGSAAASSQNSTVQEEAAETIRVVRGDTLWAIAQEHLGDGTRYPELFDSTAPVRQDDGRYLIDPDLIYPGWDIHLPEDAPTATPATPEPAAQTGSPAAGQGATTESSASGESSTGGSAPATAPFESTQTPAQDAQDTGATSPTPSLADVDASASPEASTGSTHPPGSTQSAPQLAERTTGELGEPGNSWPAGLTAAGLGGLAAAGLLALLARQRASRRRHRRPGRRLRLPTGSAAIAEAQLRAGADPLAAADLDRALRTLAVHAAAKGVPMPALRAARICAQSLEVYLVDPHLQLPSPFVGVDGDPGAWTLHRENLTVLLDDAAAAEVPAPYPTLLTLGVDEDGAHLLLNLEEVGALNVTSGEPQLARQVLTALTLELLACGWAEDLRVSLVGAMPELVDALGVDRATYTEHLADLLPSLEHAADVYRGALEERHLDSAGHARSVGVLEETWAPQLVVIATPITAQEHDRLVQLTQALPRVAIAAVTSSANPVGEWQLNVAADPERPAQMVAHLDPVTDLVLTPQHVSDADYAALLEIFTSMDRDDVDGPQWTEGIDDASTHTIADLPQPEPLVDLDELDPVLNDVEHPATGSASVTSSDPGSDVDEITTIETATTADPADNIDDKHLEAASELASTLGERTGPVIEQPATALEDPAPAPAAAPLGDTGTTTGVATGEDTQLVDESRPLVRVLGPIAIEYATGTAPAAHRRMAEVLAYLALCPGRSHEAFTEAIFPGERSHAGKRNKYLSQARSWLGTASDGTPYVALVPEHGYRLHQDTQVDWNLFTKLIGRRIDQAETAQLVRALRLVTGEPLGGVDPKRYEWAQLWKTEAIQAIADVAHEVAYRALQIGDARTAAWAAATGLAVEPVSEALWRDAMAAAWQSGVPGRARDVISRCHATLSADDLSDLEDETIELMNDIIRDERAQQGAPEPSTVGVKG